MKILEISAEELRSDTYPQPPLILFDTIESTNRLLRTLRNNKQLLVSIKYNRLLQDLKIQSDFISYYVTRGFSISLTKEGVLLKW